MRRVPIGKGELSGKVDNKTLLRQTLLLESYLLEMFVLFQIFLLWVNCTGPIEAIELFPITVFIIRNNDTLPIRNIGVVPA